VRCKSRHMVCLHDWVSFFLLCFPEFHYLTGLFSLLVPVLQGTPYKISASPGNYTEPEDGLLDSALNQYEESLCHKGHYCIGGVRRLCPQGTFGATMGLSTTACSGLCAPGYYCPFNSTSNTEVECGSKGVYCPQGSRHPETAVPGEETYGGNDRNTTHVGVNPCPSGM
jgi:hypothetical protein